MDDYRLNLEYERLLRLEAASDAVTSVTATPNRRHYEIDLHVRAPVGTDEHYAVAGDHRLSLDLPDDFPTTGPIARFDHPILAPNIWPSGWCCITDNLWAAEQHLDRVVCDVVEEMQGLRPNFMSIANNEAALLYRQSGFMETLRKRLGPEVELVPPADDAAPTVPTIRSRERTSITTASAKEHRTHIVTLR